MTSTYTTAGITLDRYTDILDRLIALAKAQWDESIDTTVNTAEDSFLGHLIRDLALVLHDTNEILQDVYDATSVTNATGTRLDMLLSLIGLTRAEDAYSTVTLTLTASKACTVPAGSRYKTVAGVTFATDTSLVFTAAGSSTVAATCTVVGPFNAAATEVNTIVTAVNGITAVTNVAAATPGRYRATDAEQKSNHTIAVATSGDGDSASIYEAIVAVTGVSAASVFDNDTNETVNGVPAKNIHCVVIGGDGADIAEAIHDTKTNSVPTYGSTTVSHYDTVTKQSKDIKFSIGTEVPIHIAVDISLIPGQYDDDYSAQIKANLVAHFADTDKFRIGSDVVYTALYAPIYSVDGIVVNTLEIGTSDPPGSTSNISIGATELATLVTANIDVTVT